MISYNNQKMCRFQHRYLYSFMACSAFILIAHNRMVLSITLPEMLSNPVGVNITGDATRTNSSAEGAINWSEETQGMLLASTYWALTVAVLPAGHLISKIQGYHMLSIAVFLSALGTALTPILAHYGIAVAVALRLLMGAGQGFLLVGASSTMSRWIPKEERGFLGGVIYTGVEIGGVTCSLTTGGLLTWFPGLWQIPFYFNAVLGAIWLIVWFIFCSNDPESNKYISKQELEYLKEKIVVSKRPSAVPWLKILKSPALLSGGLCYIGACATLFLFIVDLPKFLRQALHLSITDETIWTTVPFFLFAGSSFLFGMICDLLLTKNIFSNTTIRKLSTSVAQVGISVSFVGMTLTGTNKVAVLAFLSIGFCLLGGLNSGIRLLGNDLSLEYAGAVMSIVGVLTGLCASLLPYIVGVFVPNQTLEEWNTMFYLLVIVSIATLVIYLIFGSAEIQNWNNVDSTVSMEEVTVGNVSSRSNNNNLANG